MREASRGRPFSRSLLFYSSLLGVLFFASTVVSQSTESETCSCTDVPPDERFSCAEQQSYGKCEEDWMTSPRPDLGLPQGFCQTTCGRCNCPIPEAGSDQCLCDDVPPPGEFTCAQQQQFGQCQRSWMVQAPQDLQLSNGYCATTCGRCLCSAQTTPTTQTTPEPEITTDARITPDTEVAPDVQTTRVPERVSEDCDCTDLVPPSEEGYSCEDQRNFGKCTSGWMRTAQPDAPEGFCQWTCGFCSCPGAPVIDGAPRPVFLGDEPCTCSDLPPPGSDFTCQEQKQLGKCLADWMRNPGSPEEGYCQITCGLCPCRNPTIEGPRPVEIPSLPDLSPGDTIPIDTSFSDRVVETIRRDRVPIREAITPITEIIPIVEPLAPIMEPPVPEAIPIVEPLAPIMEPPVPEVTPMVEPLVPLVEPPVTEIPPMVETVLIPPDVEMPDRVGLVPAPEVDPDDSMVLIDPDLDVLLMPETPLVEPTEEPTEPTEEPIEPGPEIEPIIEILEDSLEPEPEPFEDTVEPPPAPETDPDDDEMPLILELEIEPEPEIEPIIDLPETPIEPEPEEEDEIETQLEAPMPPVPEPDLEDSDEERIITDLEIEITPEPEVEVLEDLELITDTDDITDQLEPVPEPETAEDTVLDMLDEIIEPGPEPEVEDIDEVIEPVPEPEIAEDTVVDMLDEILESVPEPDIEDIDEIEETPEVIQPVPEVTPEPTVPAEEPSEDRLLTELEDSIPVEEPTVESIETTVPSPEPGEEISVSLDQLEPAPEPQIDDSIEELRPIPIQEPEIEAGLDQDSIEVQPPVPEPEEPAPPSVESPSPSPPSEREAPEVNVSLPGNFTQSETTQILTDLDVSIENVNDYEDPLPEITDSPELEEIREQEPDISIAPRRGRKLKQSITINRDFLPFSWTGHSRSIKQLLSENRTSALFESVDFTSEDPSSGVESVDRASLLIPPTPEVHDSVNSAPCNSIEQLLDSPLGISQFGILSTLIRKSGLLEELRSPRLQSTMFVAMDSAFDQMPKSITLEQLQNDNSIHTINFIRKLILFNIVPGVYRAKDFKNDLILETLYGSPVSVASGGDQSVNNSEFTSLRIVSRGGSWYAVGGPWSARIEVPDIGLCSSVVHLVDRVLWPPDDFNFLPTDESGKSCNTITGLLESVVGVTHFSILGKLLKKAGLEDELRNPSLKATIFAPMDDAFRNLPEPFSIERMLTEDSPKVINELQKLLLFHVVPGRVGTEDFDERLPLVTFLASFYTLVNKQGELLVKSDTNGTKIVTNDIEARIVVPDVGVCQSIIHWIDAVLLPTWNQAVVEVLTKNQTQLQASNFKHSIPPIEENLRGFYSPSTLERYSFIESID